MADQNQSDNVNDMPPADRAVSDLPALDERGAARRRLGKAGIGAAGLLWSLESKATSFACRSPSGFYSSKLHKSATGPKSTCSGWPPSVWCAIGSYWPCSDKILFSSVFRCTNSATNAVYGKATMLQVLKGKSNDVNGLGAQLAAAYLNVLTDKIQVVDEHTLKEMWKQIQGGAYQVSPSVYLTWRELSDYLKSTHY